MHNEHGWTQRLDDGSKREIQAVKFGGRWRLRARSRRGSPWTPLDPPPRDLLIELRDILARKYRRRRASTCDLDSLDQLLRESPR